MHLVLSDFAVSRLGTKKYYMIKTIYVKNLCPREIHDDDDDDDDMLLK